MRKRLAALIITGFALAGITAPIAATATTATPVASGQTWYHT